MSKLDHFYSAIHPEQPGLASPAGLLLERPADVQICNHLGRATSRSHRKLRVVGILDRTGLYSTILPGCNLGGGGFPTVAVNVTGCRENHETALIFITFRWK